METNGNDHIYIRELALQTLGWLGDSRAIEILVKALEDEDSEIRAIAAVALGDIGDKRLLPILEKMEQHDPVIYHDPVTHRTPYPNAATEAIRRIKANRGLPKR